MSLSYLRYTYEPIFQVAWFDYSYNVIDQNVKQTRPPKAKQQKSENKLELMILDLGYTN